MKNIHHIIAFFLFSCFIFIPQVTSAQELLNDYRGTTRGKIIEIIQEETQIIPGIDTPQLVQTIDVQLKDGQTIRTLNDYLELRAGDRVFLNILTLPDGSTKYVVVNIDRRWGLLFSALLFIFVVIAFGGKQGVRSLVALGGSFLAIIYILLPAILQGWNPLLISSAVAGAILFIAIFLTHGWNRSSAIAFSGTIVAIILTGIIATCLLYITRLTGFAGEETTYLNINTQGTLDFASLLLGAMIIGILGVLDDIAITQTAIVEELYHSNPEITTQEAYRRALRIGREHVGALVNTLVLAYTGASLPLLLYFTFSNLSFGETVNLEIFATEIIRSIVGSIGLILTVPIVTGLAVIFLKGHRSSTHHHGHVHIHKH